MSQKVLSEIIGWIYFLCWSSSFYGQTFESYRLKSVEGLSLNYQLLNLTGFTFYSIYNSYGYFDKNPAAGKVDLQDLVFSYHALFIVLVQWIQCLIYKRGNNKLSIYFYLLNILIWEFVATYALVQSNTNNLDKALSPISFLGYFKLFISFIKYMPQVYWNYSRKRTVGWSIFNIIMDFAGGLFSFLQIIIDSDSNSSIFSGGLNITKFSLSIISMFFDLIFMFQHYVLYKQNNLDYLEQLNNNKTQIYQYNTVKLQSYMDEQNDNDQQQILNLK